MNSSVDLQPRKILESMPALEGFFCSSSWISYVSGAALSYLKSTKSEHELMHKSIALRPSKVQFLLDDKEHHPSPMFDLSKLETLFLFVDHENDRIRILRDITSNLDYSHDHIIIIRRFGHPPFLQRQTVHTKNGPLRKNSRHMVME